MNPQTYLNRIGLKTESVDSHFESLKWLQNQHLLNVPFENLDIHWGAEISLNVNRFYKKIVENRRGGFCYELNGAFNGLLNLLGFETKLISARVADTVGEFGPEFDHMAIIARIEAEEFLVDVGFGDFIAEPLIFDPGVEQIDPNGVFMIEKFDEDYFVVKKLEYSEWVSKYKFTTVSRDLAEFSGMCKFQQTSPESHFTKGKLCSLMTRNGRKTLTENAFIETKEGEKEESVVGSESEFDELLKREFSIARR